FNHYSASSNKLFEYLMAHVPVIGSDLPEIKRVIEEEQVGLIVQEANTVQLNEAIQILINDDELRTTLKRNTESAKRKYNWENEKRILNNIYSEFYVLSCLIGNTFLYLLEVRCDKMLY